MEATNKEMVGNIVLNLDYYKGSDLYSEGAAEDMLLDLVTRYTEADYEHVIQNLRSWNVMYHLSYIRENIISWIPISRKSKILEVGAGCGAVTGGLAKLGEHVTCIELSKKRSMINATRHKEFSNIDIIVGNFEDIEPNLDEKYDYITLIGVLEYAESYISAENGVDPYRTMLEKMKKHLAPGGKIIIAIENKYGLKYFAGCKEDHTGKYFEGLEGYTTSSGVKTFTRRALDSMFNEMGFKSKFYFPYPDYKLPHTIYSEDKLPSVGDLNTNLRNYDNDRVVLFDEEKVFDDIIREHLFPSFANSFLVILTEEEIEKCLKMVPIYAKYANERIEKYRVGTLLFKDQEGQVQVYKTALNNKANVHLNTISENYEILYAAYNNRGLVPNRSTLIHGTEPMPLVAGATSKAIDTIHLEYLNGTSLEKYIIDLFEKSKYDEIVKVIRMYMDRFMNLNQYTEWEKTDRFVKVFGDRKFTKKYTGAAKSNYDAIFSNIILDDEQGIEGDWHVLDYEWCFSFPVPDKFIVFRSLYYLFEQSVPELKSKLEIDGRDAYEMFGFDEDEVKTFIDMEHNFQVFIIGGVASLEVLHSMMPTNTMFLDNILRESNALKNLNSPKIYYSHGDGYSEDKQLHIVPTVNGSRVDMEIALAQNVRGLRIDPTEYESIVSIRDIYFKNSDGNKIDIERYMINGYMMGDNTIIYDTNDAQIIVDSVPRDAKIMHLSYDVSVFLPEIYEDVLKTAKKVHEKDYKTPGFAGKVMRKLGFSKNLTPVEGYHYNV